MSTTSTTSFDPARAKEGLVFIFDFDGCTADTELPAMRVAIERLIDTFGEARLHVLKPETKNHEELVTALVQHWGGVPFPEMIRKCEEETGATLAQVAPDTTYEKLADDNFIETAKELENVPAVKGMVELARALTTFEKITGIPVIRMVITSSPLERVAEPLERIGAADYFRPRPELPASQTALRHRMEQLDPSVPDTRFILKSLIFSAEAEPDPTAPGQRIPSKSRKRPDIYLLGVTAAAKALGITVAEALARAITIEDSPSGMSGADGAGIAHRIGWLAGGHISDKRGQAARLRSEGAHTTALTEIELAADVSTAIRLITGVDVDMHAMMQTARLEIAAASQASLALVS